MYAVMKAKLLNVLPRTSIPENSNKTDERDIYDQIIKIISIAQGKQI